MTSHTRISQIVPPTKPPSPYVGNMTTKFRTNQKIKIPQPISCNFTLSPQQRHQYQINYCSGDPGTRIFAVLQPVDQKTTIQALAYLTGCPSQTS